MSVRSLFVVLCPGILPTAAFDMSAFLTVYPLKPTTDGQTTSLRIVAPSGYIWIPSAEEGWLGDSDGEGESCGAGTGYLPNITCKFCELIVTPEAHVSSDVCGTWCR